MYSKYFKNLLKATFLSAVNRLKNKRIFLIFIDIACLRGNQEINNKYAICQMYKLKKKNQDI